MEPVATVSVGFLLGHRFRWQVLATLLPICGGVAMASSSGGSISSAGVCFAMLSNLAFCCRTFCLQRLQRNKLNQLDDLAVFFNVSGLSTFLMPGLELAVEASEVLPAVQSLMSRGRLWSFGSDMLASSIAFFFYQHPSWKIGDHTHRKEIYQHLLQIGATLERAQGEQDIDALLERGEAILLRVNSIIASSAAAMYQPSMPGHPGLAHLPYGAPDPYLSAGIPHMPLNPVHPIHPCLGL
eukprot:g24414.t1